MADTLVDIFDNDAFQLVTLTDTINKLPFVPGQAGKLGIFEEEPVTTTQVAVESISGTLALIPNTLRGAPANTAKHDRRSMLNLTVPHLPVEDTIQANEIQNVRTIGSGNQIEVIEGVVNRRMQRMLKSHDATVEYGRIGAINGIILDADGATTIYNLFTQFGISQTTQDFTLGTTTTNILGLTTDMKGAIEDALGASVYEDVHVFCGKVFWKRFISHPAVVTAYQYFEERNQTMNPLREDLRYAGFKFGGATWQQYRGNIGGVAFVADSEAHMFPIGIPELFKTYFAPADFIETVNTPGLPRYAKIAVDVEFQRYVKLHTQSNPLSICTRPETLIKLTTSN